LKQKELLEEAGIQYFIVDLEPCRELEVLETFAGSVKKKKKKMSGIPNAVQEWSAY
jgi:hypothetical protein